MAKVPLRDKSKYPPKGDWKTIPEIYQLTGFSRSWVEPRLIGCLPPEQRKNPRSGRPDWCYAPESVAQLQEEAESIKQKYPAMDSFVPITVAARELSRAPGWILEKIAEKKLGKPQERLDAFSKVRTSIAPTTMKRLRAYKLEYAPAGWYNSRQLHVLTGWHEGSIRDRLKKACFESREYLGENGHPYLFYAPGAVKWLGVKPKHYPPAGDNYTVRRMAFLLGRSQKWVYSRLKVRNLTNTAQIMLDDCNRPRDHYTPMVFQTLKRRSEMEWSTETTQDSRKVG